MTNNKAKALHEIVAQHVIKKLEEGAAPWQLPWNANQNINILPYNAITGNRYKGINMLSLVSADRGDPRWMTFKQADSIGLSIKKGEKATLIQYVKTHDFKTVRDASGKTILSENGLAQKESYKLHKPIVTTAWVFNAEQINGIEPLQIKDKPTLNWQSLERAENLISQSKATIQHTHQDRAYYSPSKDLIIMPYKNQFDASDKYYATVLHELGHWTSHKDRLDRNIMYDFGSQEYAREELRAEIASMLIGHELQIGHDPSQHISYVDSWIKILKDTPYEIHSAAVDAEKIFNYLISFDIKRAQKTSNVLYENTKTPELSLSMGDQINYNNTTYKIQGLLKKGRYRVEDLSTGNIFILAKTDGLYNSLISAKNSSPIINMNESQDNLSINQHQEQAKIISIKR